MNLGDLVIVSTWSVFTGDSFEREAGGGEGRLNLERCVYLQKNSGLRLCGAIDRVRRDYPISLYMRASRIQVDIGKVTCTCPVITR